MEEVVLKNIRLCLFALCASASSYASVEDVFFKTYAHDSPITAIPQLKATTIARTILALKAYVWMT